MSRDWNMKEISSIIKDDAYRFLEPMSQHTTLKVGGPAEMYIEISSEKHLVDLVAYFKSRDIPYIVLGHGSNILVSDSGIDGAVISLGKAYGDIRIKKENPGRSIFDKSGTYIVTAQAGVMLSAVAQKALGSSLSGFEFAAGIPGTVGGAVVMNAGAYGSEIKDVLIDATVLEPDGSVSICDASELELSYRHSNIESRYRTVLSVRFRLTRGDKGEISALMNELSEKRRQKQPLEYPSAGSTFKRPEGHFAGALIEEAGLRGYTVGGAQVSTKHCGFVVNVGDATADDIYKLTEHVIDVVREKSGITLEREIKLIGEFR